MLIDTHVLLWFQLEPEKLSKEEREKIMHAYDVRELCLSAISLWEVALLSKYNRIFLQRPFNEWRKITQTKMKIIDIDADIAIENIYLPELDDHKDPADRFIIATSRVHDLSLMTHDKKIRAYAKKGHIHLA